MTTPMISYPIPRFLQRDWVWNLWKKHMCPRGYHLFDEVRGANFDEDEIDLSCDACGLGLLSTKVWEAEK